MYELDEFLDDVIRADARLAIANVRKTRYQFRIGTCTAEYSQIIINGVPRDTVAVESVDADAVLQLVRELGVDEPNTSYIREVKRVLGLGINSQAPDQVEESKWQKKSSASFW